MNPDLLPLADLGRGDVQRCGGKAAGLGELLRIGARVPPGFCVLGRALDRLTAAAGLGGRIAEIAGGLDFDDYAGVDERTGRIRGLINAAAMPDDMARAIADRYRDLVTPANPFVAVRSSVAVKGSDISSFPGMMDTYHYVLGEAAVIDRVRECWASLWTARAAFARHRKGIAHDRGIIAPVVQLMVNSDTAGVLFTANPVTRDAGEMVIEANWGLGESVVSGKSMNDFFTLDGATLAVKQRIIANKTVMVTMDHDKGAGRAEIPVPADRAGEATLSAAQLRELGAAGKRIAAHFDYHADIEWAYQDGTLYILQSRQIRDPGAK